MPWYTWFAHHAWVDVRNGDGEWTRIEVQGPRSGVDLDSLEQEEVLQAQRWGRSVWTLASYEGSAAAEIGPEVLRLARECPDYGSLHTEEVGENAFHSTFLSPERREYRRFPGPNSNTFVAWLIDEVPGLQSELHHNAVGKDFPHWFHLGRTAGGWGLELDTPVLGAGLGLQQGIELHLLGLTAGIDLWPPAIKLPVLPRLGWPDPHAGR